MPGETAAPEIAIIETIVASLSRRVPSACSYSAVLTQPSSDDPIQSPDTVNDTARRPGGASFSLETFAAQQRTSCGPGWPSMPGTTTSWLTSAGLAKGSG